MSTQKTTKTKTKTEKSKTEATQTEVTKLAPSPGEIAQTETAIPQVAEPQEATSMGTNRSGDAKPRTAKPKAAQKGVEAKAGKLSALDAAAKILGETGTPMTCKELIEAMTAKGYWTSPGGKTPQATLYVALLREMVAKGANARFQKTERGKFGLNPAL